MTTPQPRPSAPAFLGSHDAVIDFINDHRQRHQRRARTECSCGWHLPDNGTARFTHDDHLATDLADLLAARLDSGTTDPNGAAFNWPDLVDDLYTKLETAHNHIDNYQFHLGQLFEVAQTMKQAVKVVDDFIAGRDAEGTYLATIHRSGTLWEIHIPGVGVTQATNPDEFETMARDYLEALDRNRQARIDVTWHRDGNTEYLTWPADNT